MSWDDSITGSTVRPTRPDRRAYVPPFLRNNNYNIGFTVTTSFEKSKQYRSATDHRFDRPERDRLANPFEIAERFDELEVTENNEIELGINFDAYEDIPVETSGSNVPPPVNSFTEIDLGKAVNDNIKRCKYVKPMPIQRHAIPIAMAGRDLMACAQTGSGKTAAFCFPIISGVMRGQLTQPAWSRRPRVASPVALILSPTRELSCQIHEEAKKFAYQTGVKVVVVYGGAPISLQFSNLEKGVDILVATPGRLVDMIERSRVSLRMIKYLALDEADRMLDMGFEPQIRRIVEQMEMPPPGARQTMLFSATFPTEIQCQKHLSSRWNGIGIEFLRFCDQWILWYPPEFLESSCPDTGFCETKKGADALEHWLCMNGFPATAIHGDKVQMERERALKSFKSGVTPVLVATDVAARGLDIPHVAHVINFDLPKDIDDYVHRIGRTGRAGKSGLATAFFNDKNTSLAKALLELMQEAKQEIPPWLNQCAETSSAWGSSGRGRRYGGSSAFTCDTPETTNYAADEEDACSEYLEA
ncbi:DEA(D/H)-box RNA helicase family protein [Actinidia rufa]|uniref:RNA helicase n=1 Tax=Actinidia rufa TaxID=165716 RepID=A0A7J0FN11_9ERIC|nr:DEA(D/H)-box RNA helicase family protein [Actinidia rufa]